jgi:hypothetical protein
VRGAALKEVEMDGEREPGADGQPRKAYVAPLLEKFALRPEEAVLGGCKGPTQAGSRNPNRCRTAGLGNPCSAQGS